MMAMEVVVLEVAVNVTATMMATLAVVDSSSGGSVGVATIGGHMSITVVVGGALGGGGGGRCRRSAMATIDG